MEKVVRRNIENLMFIFHKNPAIFLSEADVQAYLYSLLINDPFFKNTLIPLDDCNLAFKSKTILVHLELQFEGKKRSEYEKVDISIIKPSKKLNAADGLLCSIGIEIKFNRKHPARNEASNIIKDVKKVSNNFSRGFVLWLNWDRWINPDHLEKVKKTVKKHNNVCLYYLDCHSDPVKKSRNLCNVINT